MGKRKKQRLFTRHPKKARKSVEEIFFVEKILSYNAHNETYQIQWQGYSDITWEPKANLNHALIQSYHSGQPVTMPEASEPDDTPVARARCIVDDMTAQGDVLSSMTIDLAGSAKVSCLVDEVARQTKYPPDKFLISLQHCAGGEERILNDYLDHSLAEVGLETGGQSRNKLSILDAKPRRKHRGAAVAGSLKSGDHAGRTSSVVSPPAGTEGGSDTSPAYTHASGLIGSNETGQPVTMPEASEPDDTPVARARCIVDDMTAQGDVLSSMTIDLAGSAKVSCLVDEVARQTKYPPDKFLISLQHCVGGEERILNDYLDHSLAEVGLETGGQSRNKLSILDAKPRRKHRGAAVAGSLKSGDHAGRTSSVVSPPAGTEGGSDTSPAYTHASGLIGSNETACGDDGDGAPFEDDISRDRRMRTPKPSASVKPRIRCSPSPVRLTPARNWGDSSSNSEASPSPSPVPTSPASDPTWSPPPEPRNGPSRQELDTSTSGNSSDVVPPSVLSDEIGPVVFEGLLPRQSDEGRMIRAAKPSFKTKQYYDKVNACVFCSKLVKQKIKRHLFLKHSSEPKVKAVKEGVSDGEMRTALYEMMCEGNYRYNEKLIAEDQPGELIVLKRPHVDTPAAAFAPCHACRGYVLRADLWRHIRTCPCASEQDRTRSNRHLTALAPEVRTGVTSQEEESPQFFETIVGSMKDDEVRETIVKDDLLRKIGSDLLLNKGKGVNQVSAIRSRLRSLAKLLLTVRKRLNTGETPKCLEDLLQPRYFDVIIASVREICDWELGDADHPPKYGVPTLALKLGHGLKRAAEKAISRAIKAGDMMLQQRISDYVTLHEREWGDSVSHAALSTMDIRKMNKVDPLPLTEDVVKLSKETKRQIQELVTKVRTEPLGRNALRLAYNKLSQLACAAVIVFNKRRGGEASRLLVATYTNRSRRIANTDIASHLSPLEQELSKIMSMVEVIGKRKRRVPVLLTPYMISALDALVDLRVAVGVPAGNPYLFAKAGGKSNVKGWDAIRYACGQVDLEHPQLVTGTKLRKYLATVTQIMNLNENQLEWVANHLGHDIRVHRDFYRLPDEVIQVSKVSQLLLASEQGVVHQYANKSLDEINIGDLVKYLQ